MLPQPPLRARPGHGNDGGAEADFSLDDGVPVDGPPRAFRARVLIVLWPAFMMASLLEALVFTVIDPASLHGFGSTFAAWPTTAVYSITFLLFWGAIAAAASVSLWLDSPGPWQGP